MLAPTVIKRFWCPVSEYALHFGEIYLVGFYPLNCSCGNPLSIGLCVPFLLLSLTVSYLFCELRLQMSPNFAKGGDCIPISDFSCYCSLKGGEKSNWQSLPIIFLVFTSKNSK